ncbi:MULTISPECIES: proteasome assembly chaperone family protein [unclassified Gordonia (in: high G+C Gram-positive bacteria)]|uniref:proteasome assembly chaperone family protein n=1 Tax=unclassified Gordonia (in: high G+C Gram-positive bacteria) TaxID=2657482 RepID=UPI0020001180|nr:MULTISPECIES: PAC2 family protein [unclassified Gordonia (in: high G+C Gram-positive bacteria)]UQE73311.1 PAC2 family protein [Gordonia sp. PP30]
MNEPQETPGLYELEFPGPAVTGPHGDGPVLVHALDGYADAGHAVTLAATHLREALDSKLVATFHTDELIDYRSRRPMISFTGERFDGIDMPSITMHAVVDDNGVPFLLLDGSEPDLRWEQFTTAILALAERLGVSKVVGLNSIPMAVPHTRPSGVIAHGTDGDALGDLPRWGGEMKLPASASLLLELRMDEAGYPTAGLSAHVPHYLAQNNYPAASAALLTTLGQVTGLKLPITALENAADQVRRQVDAEVAGNAEIGTVVAALEQQYDAYMQAKAERELLSADGDLPSGDELGAEFEKFLAEHAGEFGPDEDTP